MEIQENIKSEVKKDLLELENKITAFKTGVISEDKFKQFRLTRGVYGQRQVGVQMIRIKIPYGKLTVNQLLKISDVSDEFSTGNLHLTTRQDIQIHYVKLDDTPLIWAKLEEEEITLREACGNTVRNVTASAIAGIDPSEPFDVTPYAHSLAQYFLRNPITQDMARKVKVAFSSSENDSAFTYFHDIGFIPKVKIENGNEIKGFKVVIGGGLGAQPFMAKVVYDFLEEDLIIPFSEAVLRVFDRHGERTKRFKARLKFLVHENGLEKFLALVEKEKAALKYQKFPIETKGFVQGKFPSGIFPPAQGENLTSHFETWVKTNVFEQKQKGYFGVFIRVLLGNISTKDARKLAAIVKKLAGDDIRITVNQGFLLKFVLKENLPALYSELKNIGLAEAGFDSTHDITACPGSDTCNLAVTNSTSLTQALETVLKNEYPDLIYETNIKIKISGCMNACGQHIAANIGIHGSSLKNGINIAPASQIVLGGGIDPDGQPHFADKVIKIPSKKTPDALRILLDDFQENSTEGEYFNSYYRRQGKMYFYHLLKPLADLASLVENDYVDWGNSGLFKPEIGIGECAGVSLDLIDTILAESLEKIELAKEGLREGIYADSVYNSYSAFVIGAKAILLSEEIHCNTHSGIIKDFTEKFYATGKFSLNSAFDLMVLRINQNEPSKIFAEEYLADASLFYQQAKSFREKQLSQN